MAWPSIRSLRRRVWGHRWRGRWSVGDGVFRNRAGLPHPDGDCWSFLSLHHSKPIPADILNTALQQAKAIEVDEFVPIMPDLRWDQFLQQNDRLSALVDLDAFVFGPKGIELVLLEYLLSEQQAEIFNRHYQQYAHIPDLTPFRISYRILLFLMNVLGEQNLDNWLDRGVRL